MEYAAEATLHCSTVFGVSMALRLGRCRSFAGVVRRFQVILPSFRLGLSRVSNDRSPLSNGTTGLRFGVGTRWKKEGCVWRNGALRCVVWGVYVPGGRAAYPSTVVMTVIPARLAGVEEIVVTTPSNSLERSPALQYTLQRLGVQEVWGIGGAQAIAALAYGTETIERVDKIVGPGNAWVTTAKQLVSQTVGVETLAGPSEVVVLATEAGSPEWIAADLLAQAEHDPLAASVLITTSRSLAKKVASEVAIQLKELPNESAAGESIRRFGNAFLVESVEEGFALVNRMAPEHLQLVGEEAEALAQRTLYAGAVFVGSATPEVLGDYVAGPSHVLPTCGGARYASALGVDDFIRRWHVIECAPGAASRWASAAVALAEAEGLPAHAAAALRRVR